MSPGEDIEIHCLTRAGHESFLEKHGDNLLRLNETHRLRIFSGDETAATPYSPHLLDTTTGQPREDGTDAGLDIALIQKHLSTLWLGQTLLYSRETGSTQDILTRLFAGADAGAVGLSGWQTAGRGRRGAEWQCPAGSVALSIAVRVPRESPERLTFLQYVAALAAADAVSAERAWNGTEIRIKWPNDVYAKDAKIGGVLCEATLRDGEFHVTVGVGVNVTNAKPTTCLREAVEEATGEAAEEGMRELFIARYLTAFEKVFDEFSERGFTGRILERYLKYWMHEGQVLHIGGKDGPKAVVHGLAPNGCVRVFREDLQAFQDLAPDVSSLDVGENVIREKKRGPRATQESTHVNK